MTQYNGLKDPIPIIWFQNGIQKNLHSIIVLHIRGVKKGYFF